MEFFDSFNEKREKQSKIDIISSFPSNYIGSKRRLLLHIWDTLDNANIKFDTVLDAFSGSAMVSLLFKFMGKKVYSNDLLTSSCVTAACLMNMQKPPLSKKDFHFLITNDSHSDTFVLDNHKNKFFTEKECIFMDRFRKNVETLDSDKFYYAMELINKATLLSIPNSNFSIYGKDLKSLRSTHDTEKLFEEEKWRDTTRKRRDANNEIMFNKSIGEVYNRYEKAYGQCSRIDFSQQNRNPKILSKTEELEGNKEGAVLNFDIIELLESKLINADLIYLDPPYGGSSSNYAKLYSFLEEYYHKNKLDNIDHIQKGAKRFYKSKSYQEQFEQLLSLCSNFRTWLISYNNDSFADLDTIISIIRNAGKKNVEVIEVPITYQYRKKKNIIEMDHAAYLNGEKKYLQKGIEYLIIGG